MYENVTFETIMERMLAKVPSTMDKREGSVIWDALAPAAIELQNLYIEMDVILKETFADTASLFYLKKRAAERGIYQVMATKAVLQGEFTPTTLEIAVGSRFSCDALNYIVTEKIVDGTYKLACETAGAEGNKHFGTLIPVEYVEGLETANLTELLIPAEDDEDVESLRTRYLNALSSQAYGGNIADYKEKTKAIPGVGGVKVTPTWNGGGTVKLTIINSDFGVPSTELVETVQNTIDPVENSGKGYGVAPIGHVVTVEKVKSNGINVMISKMTYQEGYNWSLVSANVTDVVTKYFLELSATWEDTENIIVRASQLMARILDVKGILDISFTLYDAVNPSNIGATITLESNRIPVVGWINGSV